MRPSNGLRPKRYPEVLQSIAAMDLPEGAPLTEPAMDLPEGASLTEEPLTNQALSEA